MTFLCSSMKCSMSSSRPSWGYSVHTAHRELHTARPCAHRRALRAPPATKDKDTSRERELGFDRDGYSEPQILGGRESPQNYFPPKSKTQRLLNASLINSHGWTCPRVTRAGDARALFDFPVRWNSPFLLEREGKTARGAGRSPWHAFLSAE